MYRVQLSKEFGFSDAAGIAGYLAELGVSHLYCSPYLQAAPGSTHGYDVVDHGAAERRARRCRRPSPHGGGLRAAGLGQVLDIVPNHMALAGRTTPGGGTCWRTGRRAAMPAISTSTGIRRRPS